MQNKNKLKIKTLKKENKDSYVPYDDSIGTHT
jgi:hypothetical protein